MRTRGIGLLGLVLLGALVLLVTMLGCGDKESESPVGGIEDPTKKPSPSASADSLAADHSSDIPGLGKPAINWEQKDVSGIDLFSGNSAGRVVYSREDTSTVEGVLEKGLRSAGASPVQLAVRGAAEGSSIRCEWRGIARTPEQRANAIRYWLGLDAEEEIPSTTLVEALFAITLDTMVPQFLETAKSNFLSIAKGGLTTEYLFLTCYADYTVQEYLLGAGPTTLSVAYDRMGEAHSYELYRLEHDAGQFGDEPLMGKGEYQAQMDALVQQAESSLAGMISNRESVIFLAPMGAHNAIAVEAWQAVEQWDLQRDDDGVVHAVRYGTFEGDPEHTQTLANLKSRITAATIPSDGASGSSSNPQPTRIPNASGLTQYYRDIGAYGDITPDDGSTETFTPAQPPPVYACAGGAAVTDADSNRALLHDCEALLDSKDTLRGTGSLNWAAATPLSTWDGIATADNPSRVTRLELANEGLTGSIPAGLGNLFQLTHLNLSNNSLAGEIPLELGWLYNLQELRLSGNSLTGCIPIALKDVATNDLSSLNLLYCQPPPPENLRVDASTESRVTLIWNPVSGASRYRVEHRLQGTAEWTLDDDTLTGSTHLVDGLYCETEYRFRVSAHGGGSTYAAAWGDPSTLTATTGTCPPPVFSASSYEFSVPRDADAGTPVGTVIATHSGRDAVVSYAITGGNEDGKFAIDNSTGEVTLAAVLGSASPLFHTLTVEARAGTGSPSTTTVHVASPYGPSDRPQPPTILSAQPVADSLTSLTLTWQAAALEGRPPVTGHHLSYRETGASNWISIVTGVDGNAAQAVIVSLLPDTAYQLRVRAINAAGQGPWSSPFTGSTATPSAEPRISIEPWWGLATAGGEAKFTVTASYIQKEALSVTLHVSVDGDFGVTPGRRTITIDRAQFDVDVAFPIADHVGKANGSVTVRVVNRPGYSVGSPSSATIYLADNN